MTINHLFSRVQADLLRAAAAAFGPSRFSHLAMADHRGDRIGCPRTYGASRGERTK